VPLDNPGTAQVLEEAVPEGQLVTSEERVNGGNGIVRPRVSVKAEKVLFMVIVLPFGSVTAGGTEELEVNRIPFGIIIVLLSDCKIPLASSAR
jgi:hypothetical protein